MRTQTLRILASGLVLLLLTAWSAAAQDAGRTRYKTPEEAAKALIAAAKAQDTADLSKILGPEAKDLIDSGDADGDRADRAAFAAAWEKKHRLETEKDGRVYLKVGEKDLTFPVPLVRNAAGEWTFDGKAGLEELMDRRIGRNELSAMEVCRAIGDAERDYYKLNPEHSSVRHFAQKILSSPGKHDGLYWPTKDGEAPSPLGELAAAAADQGYGAGAGSYHGYRYRILTAQGDKAPGGAYDYVQNGLMFGGYAVLAYPENYGVSGVMTFVLGHDGALWEKNLGTDTAALAGKIDRYDPDETWGRVADEENPKPEAK